MGVFFRNTVFAAKTVMLRKTLTNSWFTKIVMVQKPRWDKLISIILLLNEKHRLFEVNCILWDHFQLTKINSCWHILLKTNNSVHWDQIVFDWNQKYFSSKYKLFLWDLWGGGCVGGLAVAEGAGVFLRAIEGFWNYIFV